jgi:RimJ/RimL family protein N-acetyltransferase
LSRPRSPRDNGNVTHTTNPLGQPVGDGLADWTPPPWPPHQTLTGRWCQVTPADPESHAADLFDAYRADPTRRLWTYMPYGPFDSLAAYRDWLAGMAAGPDPQAYAIVDAADGRAAGVAMYLRIQPGHASIEVGHICLAPRLQGTVAATEAMYLMMHNAFALGYRRYEWKCDALNAASRRAALRLGFTFEGVFRQHMVVKGRNRDTAWYAVTHRDWRWLAPAFARWLAPGNFDAAGRQRVPLRRWIADARRSPRHAADP